MIKFEGVSLAETKVIEEFMKIKPPRKKEKRRYCHIRAKIIRKCDKT
jgi:hypothetical protein